jgi:hypothetical protein
MGVGDVVETYSGSSDPQKGDNMTMPLKKSDRKYTWEDYKT